MPWEKLDVRVGQGVLIGWGCGAAAVWQLNYVQFNSWICVLSGRSRYLMHRVAPGCTGPGVWNRRHLDGTFVVISNHMDLFFLQLLDDHYVGTIHMIQDQIQVLACARSEASLSPFLAALHESARLNQSKHDFSRVLTNFSSLFVIPPPPPA